MNDQIGILGIRIDNVSKQEIKAKISSFLDEKKYHWIATVNPEFIMAAYDDIPYSEILNLSDLNVVDGSGLEYVQLLFGRPTIKHRFPGVDVIDFIAEQAAQKKLKILLFGGMEKMKNGKSVGEATAEKLQKKYSDLNIVSEIGGKITTEDSSLQFTEDEIKKINNSGADIVLVALHYPTQERFLHFLKEKCPHVRLAIGVGGSFKFISGHTKRAPQWMQVVGLEWLWRLFFGGQTVKRIYRAVIRFPLIVLWRHIKPRYRKGNMGFIINKEGKVFLGLRARALPEEHWQMPQGGQEQGESGAESTLREISEELGCDKKYFKILKRIPKTHKYLIKNEFRFSTQGQKIRPWIIQFTGEDADIHLDKRELVAFQWVREEILFDILHPIRHKSAQLCLPYLSALKKRL